MKNAYTILFFLVISSISNKVQAQVEKGDANVGFNMFISTITGVDQDNANGTMFLSYQKYVTNNVSLGFGPLFSWSASGDSYSSTTGLNAFLNFSLLTSGGKTLPYLGAQYSALFSYSETDGASSFSYTETRSGAVGGNAGVKFFFNEYANLDLNLSYTSIIASSFDNGNGFEEIDAEGGILQFTVGIGVIIAKK